MTTTDILKLIDAGFTRDEILGLETGAEVVPTETPQEKTESPSQPVADPEPATPSGVTLSDDQFKTLLQQLNVKGASLDVPPESDIKSKLAEHFKEVTIGK